MQNNATREMFKRVSNHFSPSFPMEETEKEHVEVHVMQRF
jgi:hypothetical protein